MPAPHEHYPYDMQPQATQFEQSAMPDEYTLAGDEQVRIVPDVAQEDAGWRPATEARPEMVVGGHQVAEVQLGNDDFYTDAKIYDVSGLPVIHRDPQYGEIRQVAFDHGKPVERAGTHMMVLVSPRTGQNEVHSMWAGGPDMEIGRGRDEQGRPRIGSLTPYVLEKTVSRDHAAIGVDSEGAVVVTNHNPSRQTKLVRPGGNLSPIAEAGEAQETERDDVEQLLNNLPEIINRQTVRSNLQKMLGQSSEMAQDLITESIGGNAGRIEIDGEKYNCVGVNGFHDSEGNIVTFGSLQYVPKDIVENNQHFGFRVAMDHHRKAIEAPETYRGYFKIVEIYGDEWGRKEVSGVEASRDEIEAAASIYNQLNS